MTEDQDKPGVFRVVCPCCRATLWVDAEIREVIRSEKGAKPKGSLDDLVAKEQKRQQEFGRRFEAGFELQKQRHDLAEEKFRKALSRPEEEDEEPSSEGGGEESGKD